MTAQAHRTLKRDLGVFSATMMGLGSMVGTGVFVSIAVAAGAAGPSVIIATALAALVATCNALSSAQLAATHAVSGGTYEYGYRYLNRWFGFTAGWMFLCAKSASAATAALGFGGYLLALFGLGAKPLVWVAVGAVIALTVLVLSGLRRSNLMNIVVVSLTASVLALFVIVGLARMPQGVADLAPFFPSGEDGGLHAFLYATALMFVAYTGYGRIATMGEEVKDPEKTIPRAIVSTLGVTAILYVLVALVAISAVGAEPFAGAAQDRATPLAVAANGMGAPWLAKLVAVGAITAMLGVLLNLILGLSRVVLAMGRNGDLPAAFAGLNRRGDAPSAAVVGVGVAVAGLALTGSVETTWAFSAFTVLIYYAITNLAALRLPKAARLYHPAFAVGGLLACLFLAFFVPTRIWLTGLALIGAGLLWHAMARRLFRREDRRTPEGR